jgi:hypothetical protein
LNIAVTKNKPAKMIMMVDIEPPMGSVMAPGVGGVAGPLSS